MSKSFYFPVGWDGPVEVSYSRLHDLHCKVVKRSVESEEDFEMLDACVSFVKRHAPNGQVKAAAGNDGDGHERPTDRRSP